MSVQSALQIIAAKLDDKPIEVHNTGQWCNWYGSPRDLVRMLDDGHVFRVKRVPVECFIIRPNSDGGPLTGNMVYRTREEAELAADDIGWQAVLLREVLQ